MAFIPDERLQFAKWHLGNEVWDKFMELNANRISTDKIRNQNAFATSLLKDFLRNRHPEISQVTLFASVESCILEAGDERRLSKNAERVKQEERAKMTESQRREDSMVNSNTSPMQHNNKAKTKQSSNNSMNLTLKLTGKEQIYEQKDQPAAECH